MKRCPSCQRTYADDAPDYCSNDGMRLMKEEPAEYDPEKTMMASGVRVREPEAPQAAPPPPPPPPPPYSAAPQQHQYYASEETPGHQPPPPQWQPTPVDQSAPQPPAAQFAPQGWSPSPPQPAQPWGTPYQGHVSNEPYAPAQAGGRSRALAIAALVTGACAATVMAIWVSGSFQFVFTSLLILAILGIGLGVTSVILSLQKPSRFGGVPLAIAGLALGTAALVYYFTLYSDASLK